MYVHTREWRSSPGFKRYLYKVLLLFNYIIIMLTAPTDSKAVAVDFDWRVTVRHWNPYETNQYSHTKVSPVESLTVGYLIQAWPTERCMHLYSPCLLSTI